MKTAVTTLSADRTVPLDIDGSRQRVRLCAGVDGRRLGAQSRAGDHLQTTSADAFADAFIQEHGARLRIEPSLKPHAPDERAFAASNASVQVRRPRQAASFNQTSRVKLSFTVPSLLSMNRGETDVPDWYSPSWPVPEQSMGVPNAFQHPVCPVLGTAEGTQSHAE